MADQEICIEEQQPLTLVDIHKEEYQRNPKAEFCKRPIEMVDTIVIHHSEGPVTDDAQKMNEYHLARGSASDPWLMVAYSYIINSPYASGEAPAPRVTEGRPLDIVGAHAGSSVFVPMSKAQKKMFDDEKITCGKANEEFKVNPKMVNDEGMIKANVTTIGLVVIGNYAPFSKENPLGFDAESPRNPSAETIDLIARTACQLQQNHPNMKNIKWHNHYHITSCPGTLASYIDKIITQTRKYGCEFI